MEVSLLNSIHPDAAFIKRINNLWSNVINCPSKLPEEYLNGFIKQFKNVTDDTVIIEIMHDIKKRDSRGDNKLCYGKFAGELLDTYNKNRAVSINLPMTTNVNLNDVSYARYSELLKIKKENERLLTEKNKLLNTMNNPTNNINQALHLSIIDTKAQISSDREYQRLLYELSVMVTKGHELNDVMLMLNALILADVLAKNNKYQQFKDKINYYYKMQRFSERVDKQFK